MKNNTKYLHYFPEIFNETIEENRGWGKKFNGKSLSKFL